MPRQWEIWEVEWDHDDGTKKNRPALIVSSTTYNATNNRVWVAMMSTKRHTAPKVAFDPQDPGWPQTGLRRPCYCYVTNVREVDKSKLLRLRGFVTQMRAAMISYMIKQLINWTPP